MKSRSKIDKSLAQPNRETEDVLVDRYTTARRVTIEHVLDTYHRRCQLTDRQHEAGLYFRRHWERGMVQRVTAPPDGSQTTGKRGSQKRELSDGQLQARAVVKRLLRAMKGKAERKVLVSCAGFGEWAGNVQIRGIDSLRRALTDCADALGIQ